VTSSIDLYWLPLGAGGHSVRLNGRIFEAVAAGLDRRDRLDLYHSALEVALPEGRFVIEMAPVPPGDAAKRGVVAEGPVGARAAGRLRLFRYEVRRWREGVIPMRTRRSTVLAASATIPTADNGCSPSCRRCRCLSGAVTSCVPARCGTRTR
jgi:hypothetical protein